MTRNAGDYDWNDLDWEDTVEINELENEFKLANIDAG